MKILVVGGGGREHAIIKKIKENPSVDAIYALPGNAGMAEDADCVNISASDLDGIVSFAKGHGVDYAVVAPDNPLVAGCVDALEAKGVPCFGPRANAAIDSRTTTQGSISNSSNPSRTSSMTVLTPSPRLSS